MEGAHMSNLVKVEHRKPGSDQHVYIATPAHTIFANFHVSLLRNVLSLVDAGVSVTYAHLSGHPHVDDARNLLVADFLKTKSTHLLFWDADVAAEPGAALKLLRHDVDVVGGAYPLKDGSGKFPVRDCLPLTNGLLAFEALPTGFLCIRRSVLEALASEWISADKTKMPIVFERGALDGERVGGDMNFCLKARKALGVGPYFVMCDPSLLFTHAGVVDFAGRLSDHLSEAAK